MNYLKLINTFWQTRGSQRLTLSEKGLYFYFLDVANSVFWAQSFQVSTNITCAKLNISRQTFVNMRNKLKQMGFIDFVEGNRHNHPYYNILDFSVQNLDAKLDFSVQNLDAKLNFSVQNLDAKLDTELDTELDTLYKDKTKNNKTKNFLLKKDKQQVVYPKKDENDFSEKNFSEQTQVTNQVKKQQSFTKSVNSEEEKRKKVAQKKEKRFFDDSHLAFESTDDVAGSSVNQLTESGSVRFEKTKNANKSVLNNDFSSSEVIVPQKKENSSKRKEITLKFIPPTVSEVAEYCRERNNDVLPAKFVDFYTSKGWMIGKNKMKDWKACVRTWEKNNNQNQKTYVKKEENIEPTIGRMKLSDVKKMMTGWDV